MRLLVSLLTAGLILGFVSGCRRDVEKSWERAVEAWDSGDYKRAAEEYERYLYHNPTGEKAPEARFQLANIYYFKLRRYDEARANYAAFLEHNSSHPSAALARERLAEVLGEMGRGYEAIAEYENVNPRDSSERRRIRLRIADLYFGQRNYSQALTEYEKVIEQTPYDELSEQAYLREATIYHLERSQYQQAVQIYQKLASTSGDRKVRLRATYGLADCYAGLYQFDDAIRTLRAIRDDSEQADIARRISELDLQRHEAAQARSGLPTAPAKPEQPKPDASRSETQGSGTSERPNANRPEVRGSKTENTNQPPSKRRNRVDNAKSDNSNITPGTSRKAENAPAENSNKKRKLESSANANQPTSH